MLCVRLIDIPQIEGVRLLKKSIYIFHTLKVQLRHYIVHTSKQKSPR